MYRFWGSVTASLFCFYFLATLHGMWDLSSPPGTETMLFPCCGKQSLNHWTSREISSLFLMCISSN